MKVLVSGAGGFLGGYLVADLLGQGHDVLGLDNHSKYGRIVRSYDAESRFRMVEGDAKDAGDVGATVGFAE